MSKPSLLLVHHANPGNVRNAAIGFDEANLLKKVVTTLNYDSSANIWNYLNLLPASFRELIRKELSKRTWNIKENKIITYPLYEVFRLLVIRSKVNYLFSSSSKSLTDLGFYILDYLAANFCLNNVNAIYGYEDTSFTTFRKAKKNNIYCFYDLPIPYFETTVKVMKEESNLFPSLSPCIQTIKEPEWKLVRKNQELILANHVFVASSVTQKSLIDFGYNEKKISVIPYGCPVNTFKPKNKLDSIFRAMFVGRFSPLKGVHYLLKAWKELKLKKAELCFVGEDRFPHQWLAKHYPDQYTHIRSVSHFELNNHYSQASVLILPSLIDGFGLVVVEAMSCGIPVIVTSNTGAKDIVTNGVDGFIIPIRDTEALKEKINWCYSNPIQLAEMGVAAREKAEKFPWERYQKRLSNRVIEILSEQKSGKV